MAPKIITSCTREFHDGKQSISIHSNAEVIRFEDESLAAMPVAIDSREYRGGGKLKFSNTDIRYLKPYMMN